MALTFTLDIWPWDDPDLDLLMTYTKFNVKHHFKVKCRGHKVIALLYRCLTMTSQNSRSEVKGHLKVTQMSRSQGHITRSQGHCITLQISYCPKSRLAPVFSILVPDPLIVVLTWMSSELFYGIHVITRLCLRHLRHVIYLSGGLRSALIHAFQA